LTTKHAIPLTTNDKTSGDVLVGRIRGIRLSKVIIVAATRAFLGIKARENGRVKYLIMGK
jgi:hypothetical protein